MFLCHQGMTIPKFWCSILKKQKKDSNWSAGDLVLVSGAEECCHIWKSGGETCLWWLVRGAWEIASNNSFVFFWLQHERKKQKEFCITWSSTYFSSQFSSFLVLQVWSRVPSIALELCLCSPSQLRFERHPSVHKLFLYLWCERNHRRQCYRSYCQPSFYQSPATLACKNSLSPHLFLYVSSVSNLSSSPCLIITQLSTVFTSSSHPPRPSCQVPHISIFQTKRLTEDCWHGDWCDASQHQGSRKHNPHPLQFCSS